jgi:hypothetical protein
VPNLNLPESAADYLGNFRPPVSAYDFERFGVDVFPLVQQLYGIEKKPGTSTWLTTTYGMKGEKQFGVDLFDHSSHATAQCKNVTSFSLGDLKDELKKLKEYPNAIANHFFFVSMDQISTKITDYIDEHNKRIDREIGCGVQRVALPAVSMPRVHILNWEQLKNTLSRDFFLAARWGFKPFGMRYPNLNKVDIKLVEGAARTMDCVIPAGGAGKSRELLTTLNIITRGLKAHGLEELGLSNQVDDSTVRGLQSFLDKFNLAVEYGERFKRAIRFSDCLDPATQDRALKALDEIVLYRYWISSVKYLHRLRDAVDELDNLLKHEDFFFNPPGEPIEFPCGHIEGTYDYSVRIYSFVSEFDSLPAMNTERVMKLSRFIADEVTKVRQNIYV